MRDVVLVAYKAVADIAGKGSLFLITIVAARRLSPHEVGLFALGTTIGWMLSVVSDCGLQMHLARSVAQSPDGAPRLLRRWWRVRVATAISSLVLFAALLWITGTRLAYATPVFLFAAVYTVTGLVEFLNYFYRGLSRSDIESTLTISQRFATLACGVAALLWWPDVNVLAIAMLLPVAAALMWSWPFAMHARSTQAPAQVVVAEGDRFVRDVFPIGLGIVLSALYFRIDVVLVQLWAGAEAVASYNAAFRLVDALRLFPAAVLAVAWPLLCRAPDLRPLARVSMAMTACAAAAAAVLWPAADRIVTTIFGAAYRTAVPAFRVLALSFPLLTLNLALTHQLVGWNRQGEYAAVCAAALAVNLALNAWLIPAYSIEGAAWATLGTEVCLTSGCLIALRGPLSSGLALRGNA